MNELVLEGCRPIPLAAYLKALGVLRLVAEQADPAARGWWESDRFRLRTALGRDELRRFFLDDYSPTPITSPWNSGSGYFPSTTCKGMAPILGGSASRFAAIRNAIAFCQDSITRQAYVASDKDDSASTEKKRYFISMLRANASEKFIKWIDAAVFSDIDKLLFPPLLGSGGNDGRLDLSKIFIERLVELIAPNTGHELTASAAALDTSLFNTPSTSLRRAKFGMFSPTAVGGQNFSNGFDVDGISQPWDFVFGIEGALIFAGGMSRRLERADTAYLSYPFTVRASAAGFGTATMDEQGKTRGELWVPLWDRPSTLAEVRAVFREGRLSLRARPVRDGLDAARAIAKFGADRGIQAFERYGFMKRNGDAHLATPLGRRRVEPNPRGDLLNDLDRNNWLERLRNKATSDEASAGLREAVRTLDDGIFALLEQPESKQAVQDVLIAFGAAVRAIAVRPKLQEALRPPRPLSREWIAAADDGSSEFRLAVALAGLRARLKTSKEDDGAAPDVGTAKCSGYDLPMRAHLAPLDPDTVMRAPAWALKQSRAAEGRALAVWGHGRLVDNLCAAAQRRFLEQTRHGWTDVPFDGDFDPEQKVPVAVDSGEIAAFLDGEVRDERIAELLLGLAWIEPGRWRSGGKAEPLPFAYAALKPLFTPHSVLKWLKADIPDLPMPAALPALLTAGRVQEAVRLAQQRARASGLVTPFLQKRASPDRAANANFGRRLLAALIIPVRAGVVGTCLGQAYPSTDPLPSHKESQDAA